MKVKTIPAKSLIVKSNLPASDYVINPYVGCSHSCRYCYASFMKRFTGHSEDWGTFVDIKECPHMRIPKNLSNKTILLSSVTDPYQPMESKSRSTRQVLQQLVDCPASLEILTKSHLVTRDIDLFRKFPDIQIGISLNTLDDSFRKDMEPGASSISKRIEALKKLSESGISTYLFISPIFPGITDVEQIVQEVAPYTKKICFENLNLRGVQIPQVLAYIKEKHPNLQHLYRNIYLKNCMEYWEKLETQIQILNEKYPLEFVNYFYHDKIKKRKG